MFSQSTRRRWSKFSSCWPTLPVKTNIQTLLKAREKLRKPWHITLGRRRGRRKYVNLAPGGLSEIFPYTRAPGYFHGSCSIRENYGKPLPDGRKVEKFPRKFGKLRKNIFQQFNIKLSFWLFCTTSTFRLGTFNYHDDLFKIFFFKY